MVKCALSSFFLVSVSLLMLLFLFSAFYSLLLTLCSLLSALHSTVDGELCPLLTLRLFIPWVLGPGPRQGNMSR
jgi:hypothetical protein